MPSLEQAFQERILILDGGMGTMIRSHDSQLPDLLSLSEPERVGSIHREFLEAGADIIETNTFNANGISMSLHHPDQLHAINVASARIARSEVNRLNTRAQPKFIAGTLGPTSRPAAPLEVLRDAFYRQTQALLEGGVDCLLIETVTDLRVAEAALTAFERAFETGGSPTPILVSFAATAPGKDESPEERVGKIVDSVRRFNITGIGFNCGRGTAELRDYVEALSEQSPAYTMAYPSAGLPDSDGIYPEGPGAVAAVLEELARKGLLNVAGGCCGTRPEHIRRIRAAVSPHPARPRPGLAHSETC